MIRRLYLAKRNGDEGSLLVMFSHEYRFKPLVAADYEKRIHYLVGDNNTVTDKLLARYPLDKFPDPGAALSELFGDGFMSCNVQKTSELLAQWTPVYAYCSLFFTGRWAGLKTVFPAMN